MKRFKTILVVAEDDARPEANQAVACGADLARRNNAHLTLVDIVKPPDYAAKQYQGIVSAEEITKLMVTQRRKALKKVAVELENKGLDVSIKILEGRSFVEVIRRVIYDGHDLVIKVADRETGIFGGTDFHLMRKCPCPVWILKPGHQLHSQKLLATIDLELEQTSEGRALNTLIMDLATSLADWQNSELHLLCCWSLYGEETLRNSGFLKVSEQQIESMLAAEESNYRQRQENICRRYSEVVINKHLVKGNPDKCIPAFVQQHEIDMVVMGTVGRSGVPGLLIGNTAETVLQSIDSSVITVKPSGFQSPIQ